MLRVPVFKAGDEIAMPVDRVQDFKERNKSVLGKELYISEHFAWISKRLGKARLAILCSCLATGMGISAGNCAFHSFSQPA